MRLFVYGELCKPAVLRAVLGRVPAAEPAVLAGFRRQLNARTGYFRARPQPESVVVGLLLSDISAADLDLLDEFENVAGGEYGRVEAVVETIGDGASQEAWVYTAA